MAVWFARATSMVPPLLNVLVVGSQRSVSLDVLLPATTSLEHFEATGTRPTMDAVIVFDALGNAPRLRDVALARGFHLERREEEGGAAVELWRP